MDAVKNCTSSTELQFPDNLWPEHRITVTKELLSRFGELHIVTVQERSIAKVKKTITDENDIPTNVSVVKIQFQN